MSGLMKSDLAVHLLASEDGRISDKAIEGDASPAPHVLGEESFVSAERRRWQAAAPIATLIARHAAASSSPAVSVATSAAGRSSTNSSVTVSWSQRGSGRGVAAAASTS